MKKLANLKIFVKDFRGKGQKKRVNLMTPVKGTNWTRSTWTVIELLESIPGARPVVSVMICKTKGGQVQCRVRQQVSDQVCCLRWSSLLEWKLDME